MSIAMSMSVLGKVNNIKETDYTLNALENEDLVNLDLYTFDRIPFHILLNKLEFDDFDLNFLKFSLTKIIDKNIF